MFFCNFVGREKKERDAHLKIKHKKELYYCSLCDYWTVRKAELKHHIKRVHEKMRNFKCRRRKCDYASYSKCDLRYHIRLIHEKNFKYGCKLCKYSCLAFHDLRRHKLRVHNME